MEILYYTIEDGPHKLAWTRYSNSNGHAVAIVASITLSMNGEHGDWAAYIAGSDETWRGLAGHEEDVVRDIARHGAKLSRSDAEYFFPGLAALLPYRP